MNLFHEKLLNNQTFEMSKKQRIHIALYQDGIWRYLLLECTVDVEACPICKETETRFKIFINL